MTKFVLVFGILFLMSCSKNTNNSKTINIGPPVFRNEFSFIENTKPKSFDEIIKDELTLVKLNTNKEEFNIYINEFNKNVKPLLESLFNNNNNNLTLWTSKYLDSKLLDLFSVDNFEVKLLINLSFSKIMINMSSLLSESSFKKSWIIFLTKYEMETYNPVYFEVYNLINNRKNPPIPNPFKDIKTRKYDVDFFSKEYALKYEILDILIKSKFDLDIEFNRYGIHKYSKVLRNYPLLKKIIFANNSSLWIEHFKKSLNNELFDNNIFNNKLSVISLLKSVKYFSNFSKKRISQYLFDHQVNDESTYIVEILKCIQDNSSPEIKMIEKIRPLAIKGSGERGRQAIKTLGSILSTTQFLGESDLSLIYNFSKLETEVYNSYSLEDLKDHLAGLKAISLLKSHARVLVKDLFYEYKSKFNFISDSLYYNKLKVERSDSLYLEVYLNNPLEFMDLVILEFNKIGRMKNIMSSLSYRDTYYLNLIRMLSLVLITKKGELNLDKNVSRLHKSIVNLNIFYRKLLKKSYTTEDDTYLINLILDYSNNIIEEIFI